MTRQQIFIRSAGITIVTLLGGIILGILLGSVVFDLLPGSSIDSPSIIHTSIAAIPALAGFLAGGAAWGYLMAGLHGSADRRRAAWAGLLGFGPVTLVLAIGLGTLEPAIVAFFSGQLPIHRVFTLLFVTAAFLIASAGSLALGRALSGRPFGSRLAWRAGLTAGGTFLVVNLIMESLGWVVGSPGAAERATMLVTLFTGLLAAAITTGGTLGLLIRKQSPEAL